jgi:hypothetical protein
MSNEQDNKPEMTAMMIAANEAETYLKRCKRLKDQSHAAEIHEYYAKRLKELIQTESDQMVDFAADYKREFNQRSEMISPRTLYNEKYATDGK